MLRKLLPKAQIAFFLHTPFPTSEVFRCLPRRKEVLESLLNADLIGFQTYSYSRHFISSCARLMHLDTTLKGVEYNGKIVDVGIFPIGIDVERVQRLRRLPSIMEKMQSIRELYCGKKIIVGRDKLDHPRSVTHLLNAFERFLENNPEWHNRVVLIQVTSPPQLKSPKIELKISQLVQKINGLYGSLEFSPIHHYHHHLDEEEYFALLGVADVGLITSLRDGMNTSCSEFVVCQEENLAPLILSEFTGTAGSLTAAILVNPWDYQCVSKAIFDALTMSREDKRSKHAVLFDHVTKHTSVFWAQSFINELNKKPSLPKILGETHLSTSGNINSDAHNSLSNSATFKYLPPPRLNPEYLVSSYKSAKRRLILFDYDGTLSPICKTPEGAVPLPDMLEALESIVADPKNLVFIISGRDQACLDEWVGHVKGLGLSAEHGCYVKYPNVQWKNLESEIADEDDTWKPKAHAIFQHYTERTSGSFIEMKKSSVTWHYRLADPEFGNFQAKECLDEMTRLLKPDYPIEILSGKKNLEVRPTHINKGEIVLRVMEWKRNVDFDFILCCGDDRTDEDMFHVLKSTQNGGDLVKENVECITVHIGPGQIVGTEAEYVLDSPMELIKLMKAMVKSTDSE